MNTPLKKGIGFGLTSGVVTTLGMMIGLSSVSSSKTVIVGGIVSIAIADAVSDALGIHISEESQENTEVRHIWQATISTFLSKFFFALSFLIPVLLLDIQTAITVSIIWGTLLVTLFSIKIAHDRNENPIKTAGEHILIMFIVLAVIYATGKLVESSGI
ncbi:VIT1/CCC1 transporter family protein [Persephonella sp.]